MKTTVFSKSCIGELKSSRRREDDSSVDSTVRAIIERVRKDGDKALLELSEEIDKTRLQRLAVDKEESDAAERAVPDSLKKAMETAASNIRKFHEAQRPETVSVETMPGIRCISKPVPINSVGLYVPGGSAPLFSTVLMLAVPAKVAGCPEIFIFTPPDMSGRISPLILYAARLCGVDKVFKAGGAQAIAAMAFGTESIPKADKIFGPGNRYVMRAKQMLSTETAIDMPAGPSEVMVIADGSARPDFVAADLLSQAEHGADSQAVLVCLSAEFAREVEKEVYRQMEDLPRKGIASEVMKNSRFIICSSAEEAVQAANAYAAEHLIISTERPWEIASGITAAGSIFIGNYSPESAGDYASGTNHTLPTSGWAKSCSGVNTGSFMKRMTIQELTMDGLAGIGETIMEMAAGEGLEAHRRATEIRLSATKNYNRNAKPKDSGK